MIRIHLFKKEGVYTNLLVGTLNEEKLNMPLYNTETKLWKGIDNIIEFSIRNHDRKSVNFQDSSLFFTMINDNTKETLTKQLEVVNSALGRYKVIITDKELKDLECGLFIAHVYIKNGESSDLLYSGVDWYPYFNVFVEHNNRQIIETETILSIESMNRTIYKDKIYNCDIEKFTSSKIKSNITPYHTISMILKNFIGVIELQGSPMDAPQDSDEDWAILNTFEHMDIYPISEDFESLNETISLSAKANMPWIRIVFKRHDGSNSSIEDIVYRN